MESKKTLILTHADCDGICSGAIALAMFPDAEVFFTKPVSLLSDIKSKCEGAERMIICDIALTRRDAKETAVLLSSLSKGCEIIYFDHHIIPAEIKKSDVRISEFVWDTGRSASELVYERFMHEAPEHCVRIAIYGAIGDYADNTPLIKEKMRDWDRRAMYFEVSSLVLGIKTHTFEGYEPKREIVRLLSKGKNPDEIPGLIESAGEAVKKEFRLYDIVKKTAKKVQGIGVVKASPDFGFRGQLALFSASVTGSPIGLSIFEKNNSADITARSRVDWVKLNELMDSCASMAGGSGGGHALAAGARVPLSAVDSFISCVSAKLKKMRPEEVS